jgi:Domain of unknown function (DUF4440)
MFNPRPLGAAGVAALLLLAATAVGAADDPTAWFQATTQKLYDAVASGDKAPWDAVLDAGCMVTTEDGDVFDRAKFLEELRPLPSGFSGQIKVRGLSVRTIGEVAIVHYWLDEVEDIFDQRLKTTYVETDAYRRSQGSWKAVAMHVTVVPRNMEPIAVSHSSWPALLGDYHYSDQAKSRYQVFMRDGALYGGRDPKSATELIPLAPLVFYQKDSIHIMVFVQDRGGAINEVRELHKYNEVRMHRFSPPQG